jgi:hypothetical protein
MDNFTPIAGMQLIWSAFLGVLLIAVMYVYCWTYGTPISLLTPWGTLQFIISTTLAPIVTILWVWLLEKTQSRVVRVSITALIGSLLIGSLLYGFMGFCYSCLAAIWDANVVQNDVEWAVQAFYIIPVCGLLWVVTDKAQIGGFADSDATAVSGLGKPRRA